MSLTIIIYSVIIMIKRQLDYNQIDHSPSSKIHWVLFQPSLVKSLNSSRSYYLCPSSFSSFWNGGILLNFQEVVVDQIKMKKGKMSFHHQRKSR